MSKVAVVYWSGTGNTETMANCVAEGAQAGGAEASVIPSSAFTANDMDTYDAVAFGCPSMGSEQLEESEFEPMFTDCEVKLSGKRITLSHTSSAPSLRQVSSQMRIHSPSPQP